MTDPAARNLMAAQGRVDEWISQFEEGYWPPLANLAVSTWFFDGNGNLFDPATALKGQPNENLAKDNIKSSIDVFEDEDMDGDDTDES